MAMCSNRLLDENDQQSQNSTCDRHGTLMSQGCHGNVILQGMHQDMLWNVICSGHLEDIKIMFNFGNIIREYQQPKDGEWLAKSWPKDWQNVAKNDFGPMSHKRWPNIAPTLAECWPNVTPSLASCQANVGLMSVTLGQWTNWRCKADIGPTFQLRLAQCWSDLLVLSGYLCDCVHQIILIHDICFTAEHTSYWAVGRKRASKTDRQRDGDDNNSMGTGWME